MASRRSAGRSAGQRMRPFRESSRRRRSMAKAAVAMPTAASRSSWTCVAVTTLASSSSSSPTPRSWTLMAFFEPTRASTRRMTGSEKAARKAIAGRFARRDAGRMAFVAPKRRFHASGAVAKRDAAETSPQQPPEPRRDSHTVRTSGQSRRRVVLVPTWSPKSTIFGLDQGSLKTRPALCSEESWRRKFRTGVARSKKVAATMVGPAPPVPAVKKSKVRSRTRTPSAARRAIRAETPGQMPALTTAATLRSLAFNA
mmetsp:Transcript_29676/g.95674  ORF Transcript_29676/g.95674 Transcript_29676/m.95674 type:complete len:256 (+) Transcript_29676:130-897(+)